MNHKSMFDKVAGGGHKIKIAKYLVTNILQESEINFSALRDQIFYEYIFMFEA